MKQIKEFANRFNAIISLDENLITEREGRYFLLTKKLQKLVSKDFFYAGTYLGKVKNGKFFPSFILLRMVAGGKANKAIVDEKTEWLFICGRDVFKQGIVKTVGSKKKGDYTLILNKHDECMGYGRILHDLDKGTRGAVIENILDIGDFLRREKNHA
jgi:ribosome biogenesis protein Nip4